MSDRKAVIKNADMSEEMQQDAVECATQALEKYNIEKDIAAYMKKNIFQIAKFVSAKEGSVQGLLSSELRGEGEMNPNAEDIIK
ncbi:dynein light chain 1, cytoplasmic-like isoform X3 [Ctenopharyngodon idella]|uniref:dynein light chain 1, cytoplasmic-like isoform X3 n=1 Tax=Ctenopharyngodon idella TaxID=7959 RepID=UPI00222E2D0F|nr:dynein light chain 1, cytoplasmic-like isoform X3 [Ctenopharyngodon idella]